MKPRRDDWQIWEDDMQDVPVPLLEVLLDIRALLVKINERIKPIIGKPKLMKNEADNKHHVLSDDKQCLCPGGIGICGFGDPATNTCNHPRR